MMKCPHCGSVDLRVAAELTCRVVQITSPQGDIVDDIETIDGCDPYWDLESFTSCADCYHDGEAKDFVIDEDARVKGAD